MLSEETDNAASTYIYLRLTALSNPNTIPIFGMHDRALE
jgi:hypothetical protein